MQCFKCGDKIKNNQWCVHINNNIYCCECQEEVNDKIKKDKLEEIANLLNISDEQYEDDIEWYYDHWDEFSEKMEKYVWILIVENNSNGIIDEKFDTKDQLKKYIDDNIFELTNIHSILYKGQKINFKLNIYIDIET